MKKIILLFFVIPFFFLGCDVMDSDKTVTGTDAGDDTSLAVRSAKVNDSNSNFLGYLLSAEDLYLVVITEDNYIITLNWDGKITSDHNIYYTGTDGSGTAILEKQDKPYSAKAVFNDSTKLYVPTNSTDGVVDTTSGSLNIESRYSAETGEYNNYSSTTTDYIEIHEVTKADIGFPSAVTLPLTFSFD